MTAICEIDKPTFEEQELRSLSDRTLFGVDRFFTQFDEGCTAALTNR